VSRTHYDDDYAAWAARTQSAVAAELGRKSPDLPWVHRQAERLHAAAARMENVSVWRSAAIACEAAAGALEEANRWGPAGEARRWAGRMGDLLGQATGRAAHRQYSRASENFARAKRWDDAIYCGHGAARRLERLGTPDHVSRAAQLQQRNAESCKHSSTPEKEAWFLREAARLRELAAGG
jgi:hypothetical protein